MALPNWLRVCSKAKVLSVACLLGLVVNFLVFSRHSLSWRIYERLGEQVSELGNREIASYIKKHKSNKDYNEQEIWWNIRNLLNTLSESNPASLPVLRHIIQNLQNRQDASRLLVRLEQADLTLLKSGPGNWTKVSNNTKRDKPQCADHPPGLLGDTPSNLASIWPAWLEKNYANIQGGHYTPDECTAKEKTAIIIPYRNRHSHLYILLNNLLPILIRQQIDFRIFVVEQVRACTEVINMAPNTTFNRAMLFNIGFLEALKIDDYNCFILHDVDMVPLNDNCLYKCAVHPRHLPAAISKWKYGLPYKTYFGGVVVMTKQQFLNINGCSNLYFGWGGEDDDMRIRVVKSGHKILRYPKEIGRYDTLVHMPDSGNSPNPERLKIIESSLEKHSSEGLNTTKYNVTQVEFKPLYTWIYAHINMTEILQGRIFNKIDHIKKHQ